jgi:hypothetical protein
MPDPQSTSEERLEQARELVWDALQALEQAQRVLFQAGDCYVEQVWGNGVRSVLELTERLTELSGDLSAAHIEIGRMVRRDRGRGRKPPGSG